MRCHTLVLFEIERVLKIAIVIGPRKKAVRSGGN